MNVDFSEQDLVFRKQVQAFFEEQFTQDLRQRIADPYQYNEAIIQWQKCLYSKGWIAPNWPVEYGGAGWTAMQNFIYETERAAMGVASVVPFGLKMVAPVIYTFGNDEQKKRFLPRILSSEDWWCQGYSEPGAGSDLAALKTKAELDGDQYIVNGAKIWTTYAQYADWIFCLVRTDNTRKPQQGISFLLIDMRTPGITVNAIESIDGIRSLNEVIFDNVRVPVSNRIGEQDKGWTYAKALLAHERTAIAGVADCWRRIDQIRTLAKKEINAGRAVINDAAFQKRLSDLEIELMALEYTELRVLASSASDKTPGVESSLLKIKGTQIQQGLQQLMMDLSGYYCGVVQGDVSTQTLGHDFADAARRDYMYGRAATIYGGSNEVQKNITAKYVLGL